MYAIIGAFGQTGRIVSANLLQAGLQVRMIVRRDDAEAQAWRTKGAEVVCADVADPKALTQAFEGTRAAYLLNPPNYMAPDLHAAAAVTHHSLVAAANAAGLGHVVALSSVGAQHAEGTGNILTTHDFEQQLRDFRGQVSLLRAANFMDNWAWSLAAVKEQGVLPSMFLPLQRKLPMVSVQDIGHTAAQLLQEHPKQNRLIELHGPRDVSPEDAASALSRLLGRPVRALAIDEADWPQAFANKGFPAVTVKAFCDMFKGFNQGHIAFEGRSESRRGLVELEQALAACL